MHENRETSSLTERKRISPAGEGVSRTSGMNDGEESDCAILPMKSPNKVTEKQAGAAEVVEERARTKENIGEVHTSPTQSGQGVSQDLAGVRKGGNALPPYIRGRSRMR